MIIHLHLSIIHDKTKLIHDIILIHFDTRQNSEIFMPYQNLSNIYLIS